MKLAQKMILKPVLQIFCNMTMKDALIQIIEKKSKILLINN